MVELRKRPPPKEPAAPPPAAKKRGPKAKGGAGKGSVAAKAKEAADKIKAAVGGSDNKDKQPTVEDATTPSNSSLAQPGSSAATSAPITTAAAAGAAVGGSAGSAPPVSAESASAAVAAPPGPAIPSSMPPTVAETAKAEEHDPNRAQTSEALENPPETGKAEPATGAAQAAFIGGALGPASAKQGVLANADGARVPLSSDSVGKLIWLEGFGGTVETHDGRKVNVKDLLGEGAAKGGLVIFTYPRASTPGCTQQACMFRDNYGPITSSGLAVYGLSTDSTKANSNFVTKQSLPYPLLCDPSASLVTAIGMKKPGGTIRGVVVIDERGVLKVWFQGGPAKTVEVVADYIKTMGK